jgi:hypothetical protein
LPLISLLLVLAGAQQGIGWGIIFSLDMDDAEVVILELLVPPCGPTSQLSWRLPVCEVLVIRFYHEGFLGSDEVGSPVIYCLDHSKKLEVMSIVVLFSRGECGQVVGYWVASSQGSQPCPFILGEDGSNSIL